MENDDRIRVHFRALLLGNADFPEDPYELRSLKGPRNDVNALRDELTNPETGLFDCPEPLTDAPAEKMLATIGEFFDSASHHDGLLFYYSGHGRLDLSGQFYICGSDTDTQKQLYSPRVGGIELSEIIKHSPARLKIIILDCCYADQFEFKGSIWLPQYFGGDGCFVLTASYPTSPLVPDAPTSRDLSPFTALLVEALRDGGLDDDEDGLVTVADVARYITDHARERGAPFAHQRWTGTGIAPIARASGTRQAATEPPALWGTAERTTVVELPTPLRPGVLPELLPIPPNGGPLFRMSRHLVTNDQFRTFLRDPENAPWRPEAVRTGKADHNYLRHWDGGGFDTGLEYRPVVNVSLAAARAYAAWVGRALGCAMRVPTRSEWETAARAGRPDDWLADDLSNGRVNFRRTLARPSEVGEFEANPYDVCDLLGNVWEICVDDTGAPVLLGGAFNTPETRLSECLPMSSWGQCRPDAGFRCVAADGRNPGAG